MHRLRVISLVAVLIAAGATGAALAAGELSIAPAFLEHEAKNGPVGAIRVANDSAKAVVITSAPARGSSRAVARSGPTTVIGSRRCG